MLHGSGSVGDRPLCVGEECPTAKVLFQRKGSSSFDDGCSVVSMDNSRAVCLSSFLHDSQSVREGGKRGSGSSVSSSVLAKEALVSPAVEVVSGNFAEAATSRGPVVSAPVVSATSECDVPASYSMAEGLSSRVAQFTAEALRESTRFSYVSRLEYFRK